MLASGLQKTMFKLIPLLLVLFAMGCAHTGGVDRPDQDQAEIRLDLAERYLVEHEPREALEQLRQVREVIPDDPRVHFNLGLVHTTLENWDRAAKAFEDALDLKPGYGEAWNNLGQVKKAQGKTDQAIQAFEKALEQEDYMTPEFAAHNLAVLYREEGDLGSALHYSRLALENNRRFLAGYKLAGELYREKDRYQEALEVYERGVRARPESLELNFLFAEELVRAGRSQEATEWFQRILEKDDTSEEAQMARYYLQSLR